MLDERIETAAQAARDRREGVARVAAVAAAHAEAVDREGRAPAEAVAAMRAEGLFGAMVPPELGGYGAGVLEICRQAQEIARGCASAAMLYAMHHSQLICIVDYALGQAWHREFARRVVGDQLLIASITSEKGLGGNVRNSLCALENLPGGRFRLVKQAPTVSYAGVADVFLVTARKHADAPASDQMLATILRQDSVLEQTGGWDALGLRGTVTEGFAYTGEGIADQIIPTPFADLSANAMVPASHLMWCAVWTGVAMDALAKAQRFLRAQAQRQHGSTLPGAMHLVRAAGKMDMVRARLFLLARQYDAWRLRVPGGNLAAAAEAEAVVGAFPEGMTRAAQLNTLKTDTAEICLEVVMEALKICGMAGYRNDTEFSIGRHMRDILSAPLQISNDRINAGTATLLLAQRAMIGEL